MAMSHLVRIFTCSSVIALGGVTAATSLLACGGDEEADTTSSSSTSSSSSSTSSSSGASSSSSSTGGSGAKCDPSGTYAFGAPVWTGEDGVCVELAKRFNGGDPAAYKYEKQADGSFTETDETGGDPNAMRVVDDPGGQCALTGGQSLSNIGVKDGDGKDVKADLEGITLVVFDGAAADYSGIAELKSQTPGAKGLPCKLTFETTGTKK